MFHFVDIYEDVPGYGNHNYNSKISRQVQYIKLLRTYISSKISNRYLWSDDDSENCI